MIFLALPVFAGQEQFVKFYLKDGKFKQYKIADVNNIGLINGNSNYVMQLFSKETIQATFATSMIDSFFFSNLTIDSSRLNIIYFGELKSFNTKNIDSISFFEQNIKLDIKDSSASAKDVDIYVDGEKYNSIAKIQQDQFCVIVKNDVVYFHYNDTKDTSIILNEESSMISLLKLILNYSDSQNNQITKKNNNPKMLSTDLKLKTGIDMIDKNDDLYLFKNKKARWVGIDVDGQEPFLLKPVDMIPELDISAAIGLVVDKLTKNEPILNITTTVKTYGSPLKAYINPLVAIVNLLNSDLNKSIKKALQENPDLFKKVVFADAISMFASGARKSISTIASIVGGSCDDLVSNSLIDPLEVIAWKLTNVTTTSEYDDAKKEYLKIGIKFSGSVAQCLADGICGSASAGTCHLALIVAKTILNAYNNIAFFTNKIVGVYDASTTLAYDEYFFSKITSISKSTAKTGETITITGSGFGTSDGANYVSFGDGNSNNFPEWTDKEIKVIIADNATSGRLSVNVKGLKSNNFDFIIIPNISDINPKAANTGDDIIITGSGFGTTQGSSILSFNGADASICNYCWTTTQLTVKVPLGTQTGSIYVTVGGNNSNNFPFTILPIISNINPNPAKIGGEIIITGSNFGTTIGNVSFKGANANICANCWEDKQIKVTVPSGAETGKVSVTANGLKSKDFDFFVEPYITGINPNTAKIGDEITITGLNFGTTIGNVSFKGANANICTNCWEDKQIKVTVPSGAETGNLSVFVDTYKSNELPFTIVPFISVLSSTSGSVGDEITITGNGFGATQGTSKVTFNTTDATDFSGGWSDTQIKIKVPTGSTSGKLSVTVNSIKSNEVDFTVNIAIPDEITIGTQVWKTKNLNVDHYRNGDSIPQVTDPTAWANLKTGAWCYYNNDPNNGTIYGKLYNWYAVNDSRGLAPSGWHVPSDNEWTTLSSYLGGNNVAGGKLKEAGTSHWQSPNTDATNETGFSALPAGGLDNGNSTFWGIGSDGRCWSSTDYPPSVTWVFNFEWAGTGNAVSDKECGSSVRCIKDK